jgi:hypothetical protein
MAQDNLFIHPVHFMRNNLITLSQGAKKTTHITNNTTFIISHGAQEL